MTENNWVLPVSIAAVALVVAACFGFFALTKIAEQGNTVAQLSGSFERNMQVTTEGALADFDDGVIRFAEGDSDSTRLISVSGTITKTASPELAYISLSVETLDASASKSQSDNAVLAGKVMAALESIGISPSDIETSYYNLREEFEWNESMRKSVSVGYKTTNTIQVTVRDLGAVGSVIDELVQAGANRVNSVSFSLTRETEAALKTQALQEAAQNAQVKAQSIATGLGIVVGQVYSASESSSYAVPQYERSYAMDSAGGESAPTPITVGDIELTANVSVQFEIQ